MKRVLTLLLTLPLWLLSGAGWMAAEAVQLWGVADSVLAGGDTLRICMPAASGPERVLMEARCAMARASARRYGRGAWQLLWHRLSDGAPCSATIHFDLTAVADGVTPPSALLTLECAGREMGRAVVTDALDFTGRWNTLSLEWDRASGQMAVYGGAKVLEHLLSVPAGEPAVASGFALTATAPLHVLETLAEVTPHPYAPLRGGSEEPAPTGNGSGVEGTWQYLDRATDPTRAQPGGHYTLAVVPARDGGEGYDIIYLDGAQTCAGAWQRGMLKGRLRPTGFVGHYALEWWDATGRRAGREAWATLGADGVLELTFPLLEASMRFSRCCPGEATATQR